MGEVLAVPAWGPKSGFPASMPQTGPAARVWNRSAGVKRQVDPVGSPARQSGNISVVHVQEKTPSQKMRQKAPHVDLRPHACMLETHAYIQITHCLPQFPEMLNTSNGKDHIP